MKKLLAKIDVYRNQNGESKNKWVELGVLKQGNQGGEYMILDPTVNLAGVLVKQNSLASKEGKEQRDAVMVSVFENDQQQGYNQQNNQRQQQGFNQPQSLPTMAQQEQQGKPPFDDDIAF